MRTRSGKRSVSVDRVMSSHAYSQDTREDAAPLAKPHSEARSFIPQPRSSATYRPLLPKFGRWDDTQDFKPRPWMRIQHLTNVSTEYQSHTNTVPPAKKRHHGRKRRKSDCLLYRIWWGG